MKKIIALLGISLMTSYSVQSQEYVRLMEQQDANFYDIQREFNNYWDGKQYKKGKGWKQFKRWEWFMEPRVYPTGKLPNPELAYNEFIKFKNKYTPKKSNNKTSNWTPLGPTEWNSIGWNPGIGRVNAVTVDPNNNNIIYIGAPAGGCWKSTNGGNTWTPLSDHLSSLGVSGIAVDPSNSNTIYIATGDGDGNDTYSIGVLKSTDGGNTWNPTGLNWSTSQSRVMRKIIIHPTNSNILHVATSYGLYKSTDAGANWTNVMTGSFRDVEFQPGNPNTVFACSATTFFKSTDGGDTYSASGSGLPPSGDIGRMAIAVTPADPNYIYVLVSNDFDSGFLGLYRSTNGGSSFSLRTNSPNVFGYNTSGSDSGGQSWYDMALAVSPTNKNIVFTGGINVWRSTNGGASLTALTQWNWPTGGYEYVHADIHSLDFYGNTLFCGSDGGVFRSTDNGNNFSDITSGIQHSQFYRLSNSATNAGIIIGGTQDNGSIMLKNGTWTHVTGGDGMECIVDYNNSNIMYSSSQFGNLYKSTNGGNSFNGITGSIGDQGAWVTPYTLDPVNPNTIYLGYSEIWKSTNGGGTWNQITNFNGFDLKSLVIAPSNNNVIYAATDNSIRKSTNAGSTWTNITPGLPNTAITYISVHNTNPNILWVSFSGFNSGHKVYKSTDGGANWINVSGNLPNLPINCVTYEYGSNNGIYVGTDLGVYYKNDDLAQWQSFMDGLPNVMVNELEIHYGSGKIRAATYGRGIWESNLFVASPPNAQFYTPDTLICPNNCANFTNTTPFLGTQWTWHFPGGTPSTSTDLNPTVCYPTAGNYGVSLVVYNTTGSDSLYKSNYVNVQAPVAGISLPISETFESTPGVPSGWSVGNIDEGITWEHNSNAGGFGNSASSFFIDNYSSDFEGERDYLITPELDFTGLNGAIMTFDVAHAEWTVAKVDTLSVYYSTDCGLNKTLLYQKWGSDLATSGNIFAYFTPTPSQWRNDTVNLNSLIGLNPVQLYIENISDNGNNTYIDNINIFEYISVGVDENNENKITIYPNPFNHNLFIKGIEGLTSIEMYNSIGKLVYQKTTTSTAENLSFEKLPAGYYLLKVTNNDNIFTKKVMKH